MDDLYIQISALLGIYAPVMAAYREVFERKITHREREIIERGKNDALIFKRPAEGFVAYLLLREHSMETQILNKALDIYFEFIRLYLRGESDLISIYNNRVLTEAFENEKNAFDIYKTAFLS